MIFHSYRSYTHQHYPLFFKILSNHSGSPLPPPLRYLPILRPHNNANPSPQFGIIGFFFISSGIFASATNSNDVIKNIFKKKKMNKKERKKMNKKKKKRKDYKKPHCKTIADVSPQAISLSNKGKILQCDRKEMKHT